MNTADRDKIIDDRLNQYKYRMKGGHATPFLCIGLGHDHQKGRSVVCLDDGCNIGDAITVLEQLTELLKARLGK